MKFSLRSAFACAAAASAVFALSVGTALAQSTEGPPQRVIVKWRGAGLAAQSTTTSRVVTDAEAIMLVGYARVSKA